MKPFAVLLTTLCLLAPAVALAATNPAGVWEGTLKTPNGDLDFVFNLHRDGDKWVAEMDVPAQGVTGLPLGNVKVDGATVGFTLPGPGDPHYAGKFSDDAKSATGTFEQGGQSLPLNLKWKSEAKVVEKPKAVSTGEVQVLEGVWEGVLDANGTELHLRFNFVKNSDSSVAGTLDSLDQGVNGLLVNSIVRKADTIKLEVNAVGGSFEGSLNKDASAIAGTWSQGPGSLPLTITRKKAEK